MIRFMVLVLTLLFTATDAMAEWTRSGKSETKDAIYTHYVDRGTIRHSGHLATMWVLKDFATTQIERGRSYRSVKSQAEFDCLEEKFRILAFHRYSRPMSDGDLVYSYTDSLKWVSNIPADSSAEIWRKIACGKK